MSGRGELKHLGERPLHAVTSNDDAVPLVCAPAFKKFSGQTTLHHAWRCHHHARPNVIKVVHTLKAEANMFSWTILGAVMVETSYSKQNTAATRARVNSKGLHLLKECDRFFLISGQEHQFCWTSLSTETREKFISLSTQQFWLCIRTNDT